VRYYVEKRDIILDKYEDNQDSAWNKANKKYKNILTLMKNVVKIGEKYKKKIDDTTSRYNRYLKKHRKNMSRTTRKYWTMHEKGSITN
jgi:cytochrome c peroxidase